MTTTTTPIPRKSSKTADQLRAALSKALRAHPECEGIVVVELKPLGTQSGPANWDAEFAAAPGANISSDCKRILIGAKHSVQKRFDLAKQD
jgi:hypothetical protein